MSKQVCEQTCTSAAKEPLCCFSCCTHSEYVCTQNEYNTQPPNNESKEGRRSRSSAILPQLMTGLPLGLSAAQLLHLLLIAAARSRPLGLGWGGLARRALGLLTLFWFELGGICHIECLSLNLRLSGRGGPELRDCETCRRMKQRFRAAPTGRTSPPAFSRRGL